jgi:hypothetical protein
LIHAFFHDEIDRASAHGGNILNLNTEERTSPSGPLASLLQDQPARSVHLNGDVLTLPYRDAQKSLTYDQQDHTNGRRQATALTVSRRIPASKVPIERPQPLRWLRGIISPPPDLFARVRRGLMTLNLVLGMSLLYLLAQSADTLVNAQTLACAALVWLGCFWIYVYHNVTISPAWDLGVALSLLAV